MSGCVSLQFPNGKKDCEDSGMNIVLGSAFLLLTGIFYILVSGEKGNRKQKGARWIRRWGRKHGWQLPEWMTEECIWQTELAVLVGGVLLIAAGVTEQAENGQVISQLRRPAYGQGIQEENLEVEWRDEQGNRKKESMTVDVIEKQLSEKEIETIFSEVRGAIEKEILGENENYIIINKNGKKYNIEKEVLKMYFQPINKVEKNVNSFDPLVTDKYIIFPYDKNGELIDINLSQYSGIKEYLLDNYDLIVPKQISGKSTGRDVPNANENNWYQFGRVQAINEFNNEEKLIVGVMSKEPMFMYDNENLVIQSGGTAGYCGIKMKENNKYDLFFLQAYLSHPIISDVMEKMGSDFEGGFYSRGTQVLEKLPIINVDFENEKEKALYDKIVEKTKKIYELNIVLKSSLLRDRTLNTVDSKAIINLKNHIIKGIMDYITELIKMKEE